MHIKKLKKKIRTGSVWIDLFELIYQHRYFWDYLEELMETVYGHAVITYENNL